MKMMNKWNEIPYPWEGAAVFVYDSFGQASIAKWEGSIWSDLDGDTVYDVIAWQEIDYKAVAESFVRRPAND